MSRIKAWHYESKQTNLNSMARVKVCSSSTQLAFDKLTKPTSQFSFSVVSVADGVEEVVVCYSVFFHPRGKSDDVHTCQVSQFIGTILF